MSVKLLPIISTLKDAKISDVQEKYLEIFKERVSYGDVLNNISNTVFIEYSTKLKTATPGYLIK